MVRVKTHCRHYMGFLSDQQARALLHVMCLIVYVMCVVCDLYGCAIIVVCLFGVFWGVGWGLVMCFCLLLFHNFRLFIFKYDQFFLDQVYILITCSKLYSRRRTRYVLI